MRYEKILGSIPRVGKLFFKPRFYSLIFRGISIVFVCMWVGSDQQNKRGRLIPADVGLLTELFNFYMWNFRRPF
jgi:hypothetical protein